MGQFGQPPDGVAQVVFVFAVVLAFFAFYQTQFSRLRTLVEAHYRVALFFLCLSAAALSLGYVAHYLRGGPRIIDATAYLLQARGFASGHLTLPTLDPSAAQRGRFLYFSPTTGHLSVLFPPGYPAVLSLSLLLGSPWLLGAVLAAILVWTTAQLTLRLFNDKTAALFAALLSVTNACLRYHTAEPMSHGLCALLVLVALYGATGSLRRDWLLSGLAVGWLFATRPVTALAIGGVITIRWLLDERSLRYAVLFVLGSIPGMLLWLCYQWASTGSPWQTTQYAYYAVADGPPGCFRYGFGNGIGCLFEHGSFVEKRLPHGFGLRQALYVTLLRLRWHTLDALNVELLFPLVLWAMFCAVRRPHTRFVVYAILALVIAYLPFYFDASYPGGGARLYVDILPLEHVLVAGFVVHRSIVRWCLPFSLAGFALHGAFEHAQLRDRDGGRPMFEPDVLDAHGVKRGLVFVDTDHGFLLGHEPATTNVRQKRVIVRRHGDAHDRLIWERLGRPNAYYYRFDPSIRESHSELTSLSPGHLATLNWYEAEAEWPPLQVAQGWVLPVFPPNDCTSSLRGLSLEPVDGKATTTLALPVEKSGKYRLRIGWVARRPGRQSATLRVGSYTLDVSHDALNHQCYETIHDGLLLDAGERSLTITSGPLGVVIDRYRLEES